LAAARDLDDIMESALEIPDEGVEGVTPVTRDFARRGQVQHSEAAFAQSGSGEIVLDLAAIL
jgi:hypothetical protein